MRTLWIAVVLTLGACEGGQGTQGEGEEQLFMLSDSDLANFADGVQPVLARGCGSLDCHGEPGRALQIHGIYGLRESADLRNMEISVRELRLNARSVTALPPELILGKPLAESAGGMQHVGKDLWSTVDTAAYRCVATWLASHATSPACAEALALP